MKPSFYRLSDTMWEALRKLAKHPQGEIVYFIPLHPVTAKALERRGLVEVSGNDPSWGWRIISLTAAGKKLLKEQEDA